MKTVLVPWPRSGTAAKLDGYLAALAAAGLEPLAVVPGEPLPAFGGLFLPGGGDLEPSLYGQSPAPETEPADVDLDEFELELARRALGDRTPVLAVCRGVQVLNVAAGGDLIQHVRGHRCIHPVSAWGRLAALDRCSVHSSHHQALGRLGAGLATLALAPDGVVEAIDRPGHPFCLGVQWHPEREPRHPQLFAAFAAAVLRRRPDA